MNFTKTEKEEMLLYIENEISMAKKSIEKIKTNKLISKSDLASFIKRSEKRIDIYKQIATRIIE